MVEKLETGFYTIELGQITFITNTKTMQQSSDCDRNPFSLEMSEYLERSIVQGGAQALA